MSSLSPVRGIVMTSSVCPGLFVCFVKLSVWGTLAQRLVLRTLSVAVLFDEMKSCRGLESQHRWAILPRSPLCVCVRSSSFLLCSLTAWWCHHQTQLCLVLTSSEQALMLRALPKTAQLIETMNNFPPALRLWNGVWWKAQTRRFTVHGLSAATIQECESDLCHGAPGHTKTFRTFSGHFTDAATEKSCFTYTLWLFSED